MSLKLITAPAAPLISTADAKAHLRVTGEGDNAYIDGLVAAATAYIEGRNGITGRALVTQTWEYYLDFFPLHDPREYDRCIARKILFPLAPVAAVTEIKYFDSDNVEQTIDPENYVVDTASEPARIVPAYGTTWPCTYPRPNAVKITASCGYGDAAAVPASIIHAAKLIIGHLYEHREENSEAVLQSLPMGVRHLLGPYTLKRF